MNSEERETTLVMVNRQESYRRRRNPSARVTSAKVVHPGVRAG